MSSTQSSCVVNFGAKPVTMLLRLSSFAARSLMTFLAAAGMVVVLTWRNRVVVC